MVKGVRFLERVVDMIRHHHERVDGKGYPDGLKGDEISVAAKIVNVADAFDAMTTDRPYRVGLTVEKAVQELTQKAGTQFAAEIVEVMVQGLNTGNITIIKNTAPWAPPRPPVNEGAAPPQR
jgi:HD-GYP domain-containing protein (c-di-GMP phosphodiesterase class II)